VLVVGQAAPTLSGPLVGGGTFMSASLLGTPSLVVFWATWCPPCTETVVDAVETVVEPRRGELNAVTIAIQDEPAALRHYLAAHPVSAPTVVDADGSLLRAWGFLGIPSFVLLDADGRVTAVHVGSIAPADLEAMVDAALAGRPIPPPTAAP
jgi:peroxiredoxin